MEDKRRHLCSECKHYPVTQCKAELKDVVISDGWGQYICECKYFEQSNVMDNLRNAVTELLEGLRVTRPFCWVFDFAEDFVDWLSNLLSKD